jgi:hypothetical protein
MAQSFHHEKAASVLAESALYGDKVTAEKWGITTKTIRNYRAKLATDSQLSVIFQLKRQQLENIWVTELPLALKASIDFLMRATQSADPKDPESIKAITEALKVLRGRLKRPIGSKKAHSV